ncbi:hypothetical protein ACRAWF_26065 [Streptomyces sp. L7]
MGANEFSAQERRFETGKLAMMVDGEGATRSSRTMQGRHRLRHRGDAGRRRQVPAVRRRLRRRQRHGTPRGAKHPGRGLEVDQIPLPPTPTR